MDLVDYIVCVKYDIELVFISCIDMDKPVHSPVRV